jgi:hypothetical protein
MTWDELTWGALPVMLVLVWFLALIGGVSIGGAIHLLLLMALAAVLWNPMRDRSA